MTRISRSVTRNSWSCAHALHEEPGGGEEDEGQRRRCLALIVLGEPAVSSDPGDSPLDHPPSLLHDEPALVWRAGDDGHPDWRGGADPLATIVALLDAAVIVAGIIAVISGEVMSSP